MTQSILAAQLYTIRDFTRTTDDFAESMKKIADIGYTAVQVSAIGANISHEDVLKICNDNNLTICITHIGYDKLSNDIDAVIAQHKLWNTKHVAIGSMPQQFRNSEDGFKRFAEVANNIGEKLHAADLTFSYHNHSFEFVRFGDRTGLDLIYDETNPQYVQSELDTYWVQHGGGDPSQWILKLKDRMPVIHLKDMIVKDVDPSKVEMGVEQVMAEVGEGNLNWDSILVACKQANVEWYAVEQDFCQRDPFESLTISYNNLKAMGFS